MRKTPPDHSNEQTGDTRGVNRARRQRTAAEQPAEARYDDENPGIPRVRRASLYLNPDASQLPPAEQTRRLPGQSLPMDDDEEPATRLPRQSKRPRTQGLPKEDWEHETRLTGQTRRIRPQVPPEDDWEHETRLTGQTRRIRPQVPSEEDWEHETRLTGQTRRIRPQVPPEDDWEHGTPLARQTQRIRPRREPEEVWEHETRPAEPPRRPSPHYLPTDYAEQETHLKRSRPNSTHKGTASQRHRPIVYEPEPVEYQHFKERPQRRQRRSRRALWGHIQDLARNRSLLFAGGIFVAVVLILSFLINATQAGIATTIQTFGGDGNSSQSSGMQKPGGQGVGRDTDHPAPPVYATAAYLLDADTNATLYEHNPSMHLPMMSTTKLMTGLVATQRGNLDQKITINDAIANDISQLSADSSVMGVKKGETYTLRDLLYGLMLPSGNDAALAIADTIAGSPQKFVDLMNQRAQELGLHDTHYRNPHGLIDDGHYSSAHDLAVLGKVIMDVPSLRQITGSREYHIGASNEHPEHFLSNSNQFMWWYPGVDGGKIGWDAAANFVQVISCTRNKHHLIGVTLHTIDWWTDMRDLMNWGFNSFTWLSPREINASGHPIPFAADWNYFARDKRENTISLGNQGRYYIFTGYSVTQPIVGFFDKSGGLSKLGFPISQPLKTEIFVRQRFEHGMIQCDQGSKQCKLV